MSALSLAEHPFATWFELDETILQRVLAEATARGADFAEVHGPDGPLRAVDVDMNALPDAALALAVVALFADGETRIRNVANLRIKETDRLAALEQWGLVDVFREHHPEERLYSWWDYRGGSFYKKMGLRIDLLMTSRSVTDATTLALIDRNERKGPKDDPPSDHAPVFIDVER